MDDEIRKTSNRNIVIVAGDFNAKTGTAHNNFPEVIGKYDKGKTNKNGEYLIDLCLRNNLILSNTQFQHKMAHRTIWECPERKNTNNDSVRKNPY